jgi:shikimate kinase
MTELAGATGRTVTTLDRVERIVLVGLSGSGKSAVARRLAPRLGWRWADTDDWVTTHTGRTIADVFERDGEAVFRRLEHDALRALVASAGLVLATGGGIVTVPDNWPLLRAASLVIWLRATPEAIVARLRRQRRRGPAAVRPLLAGDPLARLRALEAARQAQYAQADLTVDTGGQPVDQVVEAVLAAVRQSGARLVTPASAPGQPAP